MGGGGWEWGGEEKWRLILNSAQFQLNLPAGAELGNKEKKCIDLENKYFKEKDKDIIPIKNQIDDLEVSW